MRRREFITLLDGAGAAGPALAHTQQTMKRVGMLLPYSEKRQGGKGPDARSL